MPPAKSALTDRDVEILECLTLRVRVFTLAQLGRTWWAHTKNPAENAKRRIAQLERLGLLESFSVFAHPELPLRVPAVVWFPGTATPDFGAVSYQLKSRWTEEHRTVEVVGATKRAGDQFGGSGGRRPKRSESTHDIHFATVFLLFRSRYPDKQNDWVSEAEIDKRRPKRKGQKLPDGILAGEGKPHAVEFGGAYPKQKLADFHHWCAAEGISYEVW